MKRKVLQSKIYYQRKHWQIKEDNLKIKELTLDSREVAWKIA